MAQIMISRFSNNIRWVFAIAFCIFAAQASAGRIEAGSFTAHATTGTNTTPDFVTFQEPFDTPPIVIALIGRAENNPAKIRITNVTTTGFEELILEPDSNFTTDTTQGRHVAELIHYVAVEAGRHVIPGGGIIEAGTTPVSAVQHGSGVTGAESWQTINFSAALPGTPIVLTHILSDISETRTVANQTSQPWITSQIRNIANNSFQAALQRSEVNEGPIPSAETIGWIAFPTTGTGTFPDTSGNTISWSSKRSDDAIIGITSACVSATTGLNSANAIVVAKKTRIDGGDGGWVRRCSLTSTAIALAIDEDTSRDSERAHTDEPVEIIAFNQPFHANLAADITTSKARLVTTETIADFDLPGGLVEYVINVTNAGNAPPNYDSVVVTDMLPSDISFAVTDFGVSGSGPVQYTDGTPPSGLTCDFISLASTSDCFSFSTDGTDFTYVPSDSGDGTDPAVTHIRITPEGAMKEEAGSGNPNFELRIKARIK